MARRALFRGRLNKAVHENAVASADVNKFFAGWKRRSDAAFPARAPKLSEAQKIEIFSKSIRAQFARKAKEEEYARRSGSVLRTVARSVASPRASLRLYRVKNFPTRRASKRPRRVRRFVSTGTELSARF
jgi:hypothetical protein